MTKRKIGIGTLSLFLVLLGLAWCLTIYGFNLGGIVLAFLGLNTWSNGDTGVHLTIFYSLLFFVPGFWLATKYKHDFGARAGKRVSAIMGIIITTFFIIFIVTAVFDL